MELMLINNKLNLIMFTSRKLIDFCIIKYSIKIKNIFAWTAYIIYQHRSINKSSFAVWSLLRNKREQVSKMHEKGSNIKFTGHHKQLKAFFGNYVDLKI